MKKVVVIVCAIVAVVATVGIIAVKHSSDAEI